MATTGEDNRDGGDRFNDMLAGTRSVVLPDMPGAPVRPASPRFSKHACRKR
jgi:hypothetical protein